MGSPHLKNINTISLKFFEGERNYKDVIHVLKDKIGLCKGDIQGLGYSGRDSVHVKLIDNDVYDTTIEEHCFNTFKTNSGSHIELLDISSYKTKVHMKNVPFELPNRALRSILEKHGVVEDIKLSYFPDSADEFISGLLTMERTAIMKSIHTPIPSTYFLNLSQSYIYFSYPNQFRTCTKCGAKDHRGKEKCPVFSSIAPWNRENVIKLSTLDYPPLPQPIFQLDNKIIPKNAPIGAPTLTDGTPDDTLEKNLTNAVGVTTDLTGDTPDDTLEKNPSNAPGVATDHDHSTILTQDPMGQLPQLENISPKNPTQMKSTSYAETESINQETILEGNQPNAHIPDSSSSNATSVKTNLKFIQEANPLNALTLGKNPQNSTNKETKPNHILEKSPLNTPTLEKGLTNADPKDSSFSPHQLRQTVARAKDHTYV